MSYSDDTAEFMFNTYIPHVHDYRAWKVDPTTNGGWWFACDCGTSKVLTNKELTGDVGDTPPVVARRGNPKSNQEGK